MHATRSYAEIPLDQISLAIFNPPERTTDAAIKKLMASISAHGQLSPCVVKVNTGLYAQTRYVMADGHRRYHACKALGKEALPCFIDDSSLSLDELYTELNAERRPISTKEWLVVHLRGGVVPSTTAKRHIAKIERLVGKTGLQRLADCGLSPSIWNQVWQISKYVGRATNNRFQVLVLDWIVEHRQTRAVRKFMDDRGPPDSLLKYINSNKPIPKPKATYE